MLPLMIYSYALKVLFFHVALNHCYWCTFDYLAEKKAWNLGLLLLVQTQKLH